KMARLPSAKPMGQEAHDRAECCRRRDVARKNTTVPDLLEESGPKIRLTHDGLGLRLRRKPELLKITGQLAGDGRRRLVGQHRLECTEDGDGDELRGARREAEVVGDSLDELASLHMPNRLAVAHGEARVEEWLDRSWESGDDLMGLTSGHAAEKCTR